MDKHTHREQRTEQVNTEASNYHTDRAPGRVGQY